MPAEFLYERITTGRPNSTGILAEPNGAPEPRFALQGTVNWMRGLAIVVSGERIAYASMKQFYSGKNVQRNAGLSDRAKNTVFEQLLISLHHRSALRAMVTANSDLDLVRVAVMTWYYGVYCAASAMIAAQDGSQQQDHAGTANQWDRQFAERGLVPMPFVYRLTTLVENAADIELASFSVDRSYQLSVRPTTRSDADAACVAYLSGTRRYRQWQIEEELKAKELPKLGVSNFRSAPARALRDSRLSGHLPTTRSVPTFLCRSRNRMSRCDGQNRSRVLPIYRNRRPISARFPDKQISEMQRTASDAWHTSERYLTKHRADFVHYHI